MGNHPRERIRDQEEWFPHGYSRSNPSRVRYRKLIAIPRVVDLLWLVRAWGVRTRLERRSLRTSRKGLCRRKQ